MPATIESRIQQYGEKIDKQLGESFQSANVTYPPATVTLIAFKQERVMELWAGSDSGTLKFIKSYPVMAASGLPGPKLREGDRQVPEGFYEMEWLNPNSRFHLSMKVNYPNTQDIARAREENRDLSNLGGDIMIHGGASSIGCLAMGDPASEELFILAARIGAKNVRVIISPCDFRSGASVQIPENAPDWTAALHDELRDALEHFPTPY